ncbi:SPOR domain-containing protein [Gemmobacter denitrificans]|uniref:SPOR domain-containing protein n=1 Tax=Gemmobacter denitrificans TaxID=3123040 RepID=A0ABU8BWK4_9RHOB
MARAAIGQVMLATLAFGALVACQPGQGPFAAKEKPEAAASVAAKPATSVKLVDRDVEAPEVFQVTDLALWDGRPSLGGVWVASPDAIDPERVILRNPANGKFVVGALFKRERDNPGPKLQISSDAAAALGLLAGQPAKVNVTALRREEAPAAPDAKKPLLDAAEGPSDTGIAAVAGAAIDKAAPPAKPGAAPVVSSGAKPVVSNPIAAAPISGGQAAKPAATAAKPATPAASSGNHRIQIGIFSVEANAKRAADTLGKAGITPTVKKGETQGKPHWSVTATGGGDKAALLAKVKGLGFTDAYLLSK